MYSNHSRGRLFFIPCTHSPHVAALHIDAPSVASAAHGAPATRAALQGVNTFAAVYFVITIATVELVVAVIAVELVVSCQTNEFVVARATIEGFDLIGSGVGVGGVAGVLRRDAPGVADNGGGVGRVCALVGGAQVGGGVGG